jgi:hypothetical protein
MGEHPRAMNLTDLSRSMCMRRRPRRAEDGV